ncbi:MAG TPA: hypothetical protein VIE65_12765 [Methylobacter sp.]|jgi:hypothetical protein
MYNVQIKSWEPIYRAMCDSRKTPPAEITKTKFLCALQVLPPLRWTCAEDCESFQMSEPLIGNVTEIYVRRGERYFSFQDEGGMRHQEIMARIASAFPLHN